MIPLIGGNLRILFVFTIIAFALAHWMLWRFRNPRLHFWSAYAAVALGGLSLVATGFQSRSQLAQVRYRTTLPRAVYSRAMIVEALEDTRRFLCDTHYERSPDSPTNFDQLVEEQNAGCLTVRRLIANRDKWLTDDDDDIVVPDYGQSRAKLQASVNDFSFIYDRVNWYNENARVQRVQRDRTVADSYEITVAIWSPYAAAVALSLGLAGMVFRPGKNDGKPELRRKVYARRKSASTRPNRRQEN